MKIQDNAPARAAERTRKKSASNAASGVAGFSSLMQTSAPSGVTDAAQAGALHPVATLDSLLAIQEMDDNTPEDTAQHNEALKTRGRDLLDSLETLRLSLLAGNVSRDQLERMKTRLETSPPAFSDPHLRDILKEIELRVAVELAKWHE